MNSYKIIYLKPLTEDETITEVAFLKKGQRVYDIYRKNNSDDYVIEIRAEGKANRIVDHCFTQTINYYYDDDIQYNYFKEIPKKQASRIKDRPTYKIYANSDNVILFSKNENAVLCTDLDVPLEDIISHKYKINPHQNILQKIKSII